MSPVSWGDIFTLPLRGDRIMELRQNFPSVLQRLVEAASLLAERLNAFVGLQFSIRESADVTILDLRGRSTIDGGESELLSSRLKELVASGVRKVLLNLVDLIQVDSSGVGVIVETYVSLKRQRGELKLLCPSGRVLEVLTLFRLLDAIPTFDAESQTLPT